MDRTAGLMPARRQPPLRRLQAPGPQLRPVSHAATIACAACGRRYVADRYAAELNVCGGCGHHARVGAVQRIEQLADPGSATSLRLEVAMRDPLQFDDGVPYTDRLERARERTGLDEAFEIATAAVSGVPVVLACMDFDFLGGSLGSAAGEMFAEACECAVDESRALISVCTSGGARMQEGIASLAQMARCSAGVKAVSDARLPYISVLGDPCFGGVTASFAVQADVILAEPGARIGFAGGRVIEQATHDKLPDGFQTAEFLLAHGMLDAVVDRRDLRPTISRLLDLYTRAA
ncbi:MAG: acetyl-CoA carboxylase carboxyl transferase subunit beta [Candidatus Dormibacteraeota bacterium]|nr:acetyl-CoA carboxylase carboxyl transferase subunit beta [Candidatus Dormibacteraeota bacterium]